MWSWKCWYDTYERGKCNISVVCRNLRQHFILSTGLDNTVLDQSFYAGISWFSTSQHVSHLPVILLISFNTRLFLLVAQAQHSPLQETVRDTDQHHILLHLCEVSYPSCLPSVPSRLYQSFSSSCSLGSQAQLVMMNVEQAPAQAPALPHDNLLPFICRHN